LPRRILRDKSRQIISEIKKNLAAKLEIGKQNESSLIFVLHNLPKDQGAGEGIAGDCQLDFLVTYIGRGGIQSTHPQAE
jgi:hypothetical protein